MHTIFIAYAPGDEAAALIVDAYLRASSFSTRRTQDNRDLPSHLPDQTTQHWQALRSADALVLLWSRRAASSVKVGCDWEYALRRRLPVYILWLDSTPQPVVLQDSVMVAGLPGPDTLPRLVRALKTEPALSNPLVFHQPIEKAFVDFVCWFFDSIQWEYQPARGILPLTVHGIPNLPEDSAYQVKFLREPSEGLWPFYESITGPLPLLLLEFDSEAFEQFYFFQAEAWVYANGNWEPYTWVQCAACLRWQLAADVDDGDDIYETWCPLCAADSG